MAWSQLPDELLDVIFMKLGLQEHFQFGATCKPWQSVTDQRMQHQSLQLLMPNKLTCYQKQSTLFCLSQGTLHRLTCQNQGFLRRSERAIPCHGSSTGGWSVIYDYDFRMQHLYLANPITRERIDLGSLNAEGLQHSRFPVDVKAAALSSSPTSGGDCVLVVLVVDHLGGCTLASCWPRDQNVAWSFLVQWRHDGSLRPISMAFHKVELYIMDRYGNTEVIAVDPLLTRTQFSFALHSFDGFLPRKLVSCDGDLLLLTLKYQKQKI